MFSANFYAFVQMRAGLGMGPCVDIYVLSISFVLPNLMLEETFSMHIKQ